MKFVMVVLFSLAVSKQETNLTSSCFTFVKRLIYMEPAEFVRNAGLSGRRSDVAPSTKPPKPHKRKKQKTLPGKSEVELTKPSLKLKLKRQKLKKSLSQVKMMLSGGMASEGSVPTLDADVLKEEPQFHSTPVSAETEALVDSSSSLGADCSEWKLMKPKKIFIKKESSVLPKSTKTESEQVAEAGEVCPPPEIPEIPTEALVPSIVTQLPTADTNQSGTNQSETNQSVTNQSDTCTPLLKVENKDDQSVENKDSQNDSKLSPTPAIVASVKVVDEGHALISNKKKSTVKSVAKKSLAKRVKPGPKVEKITVKMLYTEGLPDGANRQTNIPLGQDLDDVSVTRLYYLSNHLLLTVVTIINIIFCPEVHMIA